MAGDSDFAHLVDKSLPEGHQAVRDPGNFLAYADGLFERTSEALSALRRGAGSLADEFAAPAKAQEALSEELRKLEEQAVSVWKEKALGDRPDPDFLFIWGEKLHEECLEDAYRHREAKWDLGDVNDTRAVMGAALADLGKVSGWEEAERQHVLGVLSHHRKHGLDEPVLCSQVAECAVQEARPAGIAEEAPERIGDSIPVREAREAHYRGVWGRRLGAMLDKWERHGAHEECVGRIRPMAREVLERQGQEDIGMWIRESLRDREARRHAEGELGEKEDLEDYRKMVVEGFPREPMVGRTEGIPERDREAMMREGMEFGEAADVKGPEGSEGVRSRPGRDLGDGPGR